MEASQATNLPAAARDFEKHLLMQEEEGANYFFGGADALRDELFWQTGYGDPANPRPRQGRGRRAVGGATPRQNPGLGENRRMTPTCGTPRSGWRKPPARAAAMDDSERTLSKATAAERALFYRRVLAAWEFLLAVNEKPALARVHELTATGTHPAAADKVSMCQRCVDFMRRLAYPDDVPTDSLSPSDGERVRVRGCRSSARLTLAFLLASTIQPHKMSS